MAWADANPATGGSSTDYYETVEERPAQPTYQAGVTLNPSYEESARVGGGGEGGGWGQCDVADDDGALGSAPQPSAARPNVTNGAFAAPRGRPNNRGPLPPRAPQARDRTASVVANIAQMKKTRSDRMLHVGLLVGVAVAISVAIYAATLPRDAATSADSADSGTTVVSPMAEQSDPALVVLLARVEATEVRMAARDDVIAQLNDTNIEQASIIASLQTTTADQASIVTEQRGGIIALQTTMTAEITNLTQNLSTATAEIAELRAADAAKDALLTDMLARIEAQDGRVAALETAVAEGENATAAVTAAQNTQAADIAALQSNVTAAIVSSSGADLDLCRGMFIGSDAELVLLAPATRSCIIMTGDLTIRGVSNATLLAEAFRSLRWVTGSLHIQNNPELVTLDGAFSSLVTVGNALGIQNNLQLINIGTAFTSLQMVDNQLMWYCNGRPSGTAATTSTAGTQAFCASAVATLCPTTTSYTDNAQADDADDCCATYCATSADC